MTVRERKDFSKTDDAIIAMKGVEDEAKAYTDYMSRAKETNDPELKATLEDVAKEELVHLGEFKQRADEAIGNIDSSVDEGEEEATVGVKKAQEDQADKDDDGGDWRRNAVSDTTSYTAPLATHIGRLAHVSLNDDNLPPRPRRRVNPKTGYLYGALTDYITAEEKQKLIADSREAERLDKREQDAWEALARTTPAAAQAPFDRTKFEQSLDAQDQSEKDLFDTHSAAMGADIDNAIRALGPGAQDAFESIVPILRYATNGFVGSDDAKNGHIKWNWDQNKAASNLISQRFSPTKGTSNMIYNDRYDMALSDMSANGVTDTYEDYIDNLVSTSGQLGALNSLIDMIYGENLWDDSLDAKILRHKNDLTKGAYEAGSAQDEYIKAPMFKKTDDYANVKKMATYMPDEFAFFLNHIRKGIESGAYISDEEKKRGRRPVSFDKYKFIQSLPNTNYQTKWDRIKGKALPPSIWTEINKDGRYGGQITLPSQNIPKMYSEKMTSADDRNHIGTNFTREAVDDDGNSIDEFVSYPLSLGNRRDLVYLHYAFSRLKEAEEARGEGEGYYAGMAKYATRDENGDEYLNGLEDTVKNRTITDFINNKERILFDPEKLHRINQGLIKPDQMTQLEKDVNSIYQWKIKNSGKPTITPQDIMTYAKEMFWDPERDLKISNDIFRKRDYYAKEIDNILANHGFKDPNEDMKKRVAEAGSESAARSLINAEDISSYSKDGKYMPLDTLYLLYSLRQNMFGDDVKELMNAIEQDTHYGPNVLNDPSQSITPGNYTVGNKTKSFGRMYKTHPAYHMNATALYFLPRYLDMLIDSYKKDDGFKLSSDFGTKYDHLKFGDDVARELAKDLINTYAKTRHIGPNFSGRRLKSYMSSIYGDPESDDPREKARAIFASDDMNDMIPGVGDYYKWMKNKLFTNKGMKNIWGSSGKYALDGTDAFNDQWTPPSIARLMSEKKDDKGETIRAIPPKLLMLALMTGNINERGIGDEYLRKILGEREATTVYDNNNGSTVQRPYSEEDWKKFTDNAIAELENYTKGEEGQKLGLQDISADIDKYLEYTVRPSVKGRARTLDDVLYTIYSKAMGQTIGFDNVSNERKVLKENRNNAARKADDYTPLEKAIMSKFMLPYLKQRTAKDTYNDMRNAGPNNAFLKAGGPGSLFKEYRILSNKVKLLNKINEYLKDPSNIENLYNLLESFQYVMSPRTPASTYFRSNEDEYGPRGYKEPVSAGKRKELVRTIFESLDPYTARRIMMNLDKKEEIAKLHSSDDYTKLVDMKDFMQKNIPFTLTNENGGLSDAALDYLDREGVLNDQKKAIESELNDLKNKYDEGDTSLTDRISELENDLEYVNSTMNNLPSAKLNTQRNDLTSKKTDAENALAKMNTEDMPTVLAEYNPLLDARKKYIKKIMPEVIKEYSGAGSKPRMIREMINTFDQAAKHPGDEKLAKQAEDLFHAEVEDENFYPEYKPSKLNEYKEKIRSKYAKDLEDWIPILNKDIAPLTDMVMRIDPLWYMENLQKITNIPEKKDADGNVINKEHIRLNKLLASVIPLLAPLVKEWDEENPDYGIARSKRDDLLSSIGSMEGNITQLNEQLSDLNKEESSMKTELAKRKELKEMLSKLSKEELKTLSDRFTGDVSKYYDDELGKIDKDNERKWKRAHRGGTMGDAYTGYKVANFLTNMFRPTYNYQKTSSNGYFTNPYANLTVSSNDVLDSTFMRGLVRDIYKSTQPALPDDPEAKLKEKIDRINRGISSKYKQSIMGQEYDGEKGNVVDMVERILDQAAHENLTISDVDKLMMEIVDDDSGFVNELPDWRDYITDEMKNNSNSSLRRIWENSSPEDRETIPFDEPKSMFSSGYLNNKDNNELLQQLLASLFETAKENYAKGIGPIQRSSHGWITIKHPRTRLF